LHVREAQLFLHQSEVLVRRRFDAARVTKGVRYAGIGCDAARSQLNTVVRPSGPIRDDRPGAFGVVGGRGTPGRRVS
jgi:hypothetical protein